MVFMQLQSLTSVNTSMILVLMSKKVEKVMRFEHSSMLIRCYSIGGTELVVEVMVKGESGPQKIDFS